MKKNTIVLVAVALLLLAGAAVAFYLLGQKGEDKPPRDQVHEDGKGLDDPNGSSAVEQQGTQKGDGKQSGDEKDGGENDGPNDGQVLEQAGEEYEGETGTAKISVIVTELMGNKTFTVTVHGIKQRGADSWTLGEPTRPKNKTGDEYTRATTGDSMFLFIFDGAGKEMAYCELEYRDYDAEVVELAPESD